MRQPPSVRFGYRAGDAEAGDLDGAAAISGKFVGAAVPSGQPVGQTVPLNALADLRLWRPRHLRSAEPAQRSSPSLSPSSWRIHRRFGMIRCGRATGRDYGGMHVWFTRNEILDLAEEYLSLPSYQPGVPNGEADRRLGLKLGAARERGHMVLDDLRATASWKYRGKALMNLVEENTDEKVVDVTRASFAATDERQRIDALRTLRGVDWPMASTILHFAFPDRYPIVDKRVMRTIGGRSPGRFNLDEWVRFTNFSRDQSQKFGVTMRELDRALWTYDQKRTTKRRL